MEVFERVSGARMHTAAYRPFSFGGDLMFGQVSADISWAISRGLRMISGAFLGLLNNRAFRSRCSGIGMMSARKLSLYGIQGVIARAAGMPLDSRLGLGAPSYSAYRTTALSTFLGKRGDCYDRFVVRGREIVESFRIIVQVLESFERGLSSARSSRRSRSKFVSMEAVIEHFKSTTYSPSADRGLG